MTISSALDFRPKRKASMYVLDLFSFHFDLLNETFEFKERKTNC